MLLPSKRKRLKLKILWFKFWEIIIKSWLNNYSFSSRASLRDSYKVIQFMGLVTAITWILMEQLVKSVILPSIKRKTSLNKFNRNSLNFEPIQTPKRRLLQTSKNLWPTGSTLTAPRSRTGMTNKVLNHRTLWFKSKMILKLLTPKPQQSLRNKLSWISRRLWLTESTIVCIKKECGVSSRSDHVWDITHIHI